MKAIYTNITHKSSEEFHHHTRPTRTSNNPRTAKIRLPRIKLTFVGQKWRPFFHGSFVLRHGEPFAEEWRRPLLRRQMERVKGPFPTRDSTVSSVSLLEAAECEVTNRLLSRYAQSRCLSAPRFSTRGRWLISPTGTDRRILEIGKLGFKERALPWGESREKFPVFLPFFSCIEDGDEYGWMRVENPVAVLLYEGSNILLWIFVRLNLCIFQSFFA